MKRNSKVFWRSFFVSFMIVLAICIIFAGIGECYKQIRRIGFGEYKNAVGYSDGEFHILDFTI